MSVKQAEALNSLKKHDLLSDERVDPESLRRQAQNFWDQEYFQDAIDLFALAEDKEGLERALDYAIKEGDFFSAKNAGAKLGITLSREQLTALAQKALETGKLRFALQAYTLLGDEANIERTREIINKNHT